MKISMPTWRWQYCNQSGWSFQAGNPHLVNRSNQSMWGIPRHDKVNVDGQRCLHVFGSKWKILHDNKVLISYRSKDDNIEMWFARLNGIWLKEVKFHNDGWAELIRFDAGITVVNTPYSWASLDGIANWIVLDDLD